MIQVIKKYWQWFLIGTFFLLTLIITLMFRQARSEMRDYTQAFVTQQAFDSIQNKNIKITDSLRFSHVLLGKRLDSVSLNDRIYIEQLLAEQTWFEAYKNKKNEEINRVHNVNNHELQRLYANFEE